MRRSRQGDSGRPAAIRSAALAALAPVVDDVAAAAERLVAALVPSCVDACEVRLEADAEGVRTETARGDLRVVPTADVLRRQALERRTTVTWRSTAEPATVVVACVVDEDHAIGTMTCLLRGQAVGDADVAAIEDVGALLDLAVGRSMLRTRARVAARRSQRIASQLHQLLAASMIVAGREREDEVLEAVAARARGVFDADEVVVTLETGPAAPLRVVAHRDRATPGVRTDAGPPPVPGTGTPPVRAGEWLVAPLLVRRGESRGAIAIRHREGSQFSDDDVEVASLLAQLASSALDATELHRAIRRNEERIRVLVNTAPVGIVETGPDGAIRWWNQSAGALFGWPDAATHGAAASLPTAVRTALEEPWAAVLEGREAGARDLPSVELAGRRRVLAASAALVPPTVGREASVLTVVEDVTDQRQLMEELRHAQRMEVIGQLSSSVAHDFNNLLTLIAGYAELLVLEARGQARMTQLARDIQATTTRASTLTGKLLTMGRTKLPEPVAFSPVASVRELSEVLDRILGKDVALHLELDDATRLIRADPDQFEQMVMNLATNARDAMAEGGSLRVVIEPVTLALDEAARARLPTGDYVRVAVSDTGGGMDEETARRCFEPLFTTKGPSKGTGLGLPAARRVVVESGGSIEVHSVIGEGTTFEILFPSVDEGPVVVEEPEPAPRGGAGVTVLLAEDEEGIRALIARILRHNGYDVLEAESAEAALEVALDHPEPIGLLVSDVVLGGMTGGELAMRLQADRPDLLVVLVSGNVDEAVLGSVAEGSGSFLPKPFKPSELIGVIDELRGRREPELR